MRWLFVIVIVFLRKTEAIEVALFPLNGCYSHDIMMREVGKAFGPTANITWIQTFLYNFGSGEIDLPSNWTRLSLWGYDEEGTVLLRKLGSLLWQQNVPTDFDRLWDLRGLIYFVKIIERNQIFCEKMFDDKRFLQYERSQKADIVIWDYFQQECMGSLASRLNSTVVQFSNWPVSDGYISSMNVHANPSAFPKTGTPYSGHGMSFSERIANTYYHFLLILNKYAHVYAVWRMYAMRRLPKVNAIQLEAERPIYAVRSEFIFDVVRPTNNRVKHFSGISKINRSDYVTLLPEATSRAFAINCNQPVTGSHYTNSSTGNPRNSSTVIASNNKCICSPPAHPAIRTTATNRRSRLYQGLAVDELQRRFEAVSTKFPELKWSSLARKQFVLVTFGSIAQAERMPLEMAKKFFDAFSQSQFTVIWQTNSASESLIWASNVTVPANVLLTKWVPVKHILAHPNLQYIICHGGINTINELLLFGVPVLGVHLQGDQVSNLQRLVDLGGAVKISVREISQGALPATMRTFEKNLDRHWKRIGQLSEMLETYIGLHSNEQDFWIGWSLRHGKRLLGRRILRMSYVGDTENVFWISVTMAVTALIAMLS